MERIKHIFASIELISEDDFTDWELDFIGSLEKQFKKYGSLTEKQEEVLEDVFRKVKER